MTLKIALRVIAVGLVFAGPLQAAASDADVFKARRAALMEKLDGGVAVLYGANDAGALVKGGFVQESSFYYLTGISEPGAALILAPGEHRYRETLYLQPRNPEIENWDGRREPLGDALNEALGFDRVARTYALPSDLTAMLQRSKKAVEPGQLEFQLQSVVEHAYEMEGAQFLGLDVHDAGNYDLPLKAGVVITVEPGIYIPEEGIGIRIEDDILVTRDGPVLLSKHIPRTVEDIERTMAE